MLKVLVRSPPPVQTTACRVHVGRGRLTTIDHSAFVMVTKYAWHLRRSSCRAYVCRSITRQGKQQIIYLHRWLMHCPENKETHHINGDTLDNRRSNLAVVDPSAHRRLRIYRQAPRRSPPSRGSAEE